MNEYTSERIPMKYISIGVVLCLLSVGLLISNRLHLLAGILLIAGVWLGIKGRNKLDGKQ
jgi:hypothetical protein